jgi:hypothetical protein
MFSFGAIRAYPIQLRPFSSVSVIGSPCFTYSMLCSDTVEHMNKIGHAFALDSPDLYAHHLALDAIQVLVGFLSDATTLRPLVR